jgi:hypothetical protein
MPVYVACVIDNTMAVFVFAFLCEKVLNVLQSLNTENPVHGIVLCHSNLLPTCFRSLYTHVLNLNFEFIQYASFMFYINHKCTECIRTVWRHAFPKFCSV